MCNLRITQTKVNKHFAYHAFEANGTPCKIDPMQVKLKEIRGDRTLEEIADEIGVEISTVQRYLSEFTFRASNRERVNGMFDLLVGAL